MAAVPVYILAGGRSRRFGSDKARAVVDGQPLMVRIAQAARPVAARITVVAREPGQYADLGLRTIADVVPDLGPVGGLLTALRDLHDDERWLCLLSCDLLRVEPAWIDALWNHRGEARAVAFRADERWQPMLALYRRDALEAVERHAAGSSRAMQALLATLGCAAAPLPADWPAVVQANRPEDLSRGTPGPRG